MMKPINIAINGRYLTRPVSGVERFAHHLITAFIKEASFRKRSLRVTYYIPSSAVLFEQPPDGANLVRCGVLSGHLWEQLELPLARRERWLYSPCNVGPVAARDHVVTIHDAQVFLTPGSYAFRFRALYRFLLPSIARQARAVTTDSRYSAKKLEEYGVVVAEKLHVIQGGGEHILSVAADNFALERYDLKPGQYLLVIGSISPHKNIETVVNAICQTKRSRLTLIVAGGGNQSVFSSAGFPESDRVRFLGRVSDSELRALYDGAKALLFPSFYEGFGLPPLEAMNCGCPVIASNTSAMPEVCGDGAFYVAPDDTLAWAEAIDKLEDNSIWLTDLISAGRQHISELNWKRAGVLFYDLLCDLQESDDYKNSILS